MSPISAETNQLYFLQLRMVLFSLEAAKLYQFQPDFEMLDQVLNLEVSSDLKAQVKSLFGDQIQKLLTGSKDPRILAPLRALVN